MSISRFREPEAKSYSIENFLSTFVPLSIPAWQRSYSWESQQIEDFLHDLKNFFEENKDRPPRKSTYYLLGQIIFVENEESNYEIVDGQQRISSLYLLLIVLYRLMNNLEGNGEKLIHTRGSISLKLRTNDHNEFYFNLKSEYQNATKVFEHFLEHGNDNLERLGTLNISQEKLIKAYGEMESWINKYLQEGDVVSFALILLQRVFITTLELATVNDAIDAFEKMNNRGKDLDDSDLLKNYLFKEIDESKYEALAKNWSEMNKNISGIVKTQKVLRSEATFIKFLGVSEIGRKINNTKQLFEYLDEKYESPKAKFDYSSNLPSISRQYKQICNFKSDDSRPNFDNTVLLASRHLRAVQTVPALLAARNFDSYTTLAKLIDARFAVYILGKERTQDFESLIPRLVTVINSHLNSSSSPDEIIEKFNRAPGFNYPEMKDQLISGIKSLDYQKTSQRLKLRFVLAKVSRAFDMEAKYGDYAQPFDISYMKTSRGLQEGNDLDHILGQQFLGEFDETDLKTMNEIGALTLVHSSEHRAPDISDKLPHQKIGLYSQSRYLLTKSLVAEHNLTSKVQSVISQIQETSPVISETWGPSQVEERTNFIIGSFVKLLGSTGISSFK